MPSDEDGSGMGIRQAIICRPLAVVQKLGKDNPVDNLQWRMDDVGCMAVNPQGLEQYKERNETVWPIINTGFTQNLKNFNAKL